MKTSRLKHRTVAGLLAMTVERHVRPDLSPCREWQHAKSGMGYGVVHHAGKRWYAHRLMFVLAHGPLTKPCVCHHCDNPSCIEPLHLFEGTRSDNTADMHRKGRDGRSGYKLTWATAEAIRREYADGGTSIRKLARKHGVGRSTVHHVLREGGTW